MKKALIILFAAALFTACGPNGNDNTHNLDSMPTNDTGTGIEGTGGGSTGNSESNALADSSTKMSDSNGVAGSALREDSAKTPH